MTAFSPCQDISHDRLYKTCAALPARYNCSQDTGLSNLTIVQPMLYTRCGVTAAMGRRFDESYGNNGNYEIYEISAPPKLAVQVKKRAVSTLTAKKARRTIYPLLS